MKRNISAISLLFSGVLLIISGCSERNSETSTPDNIKKEVEEVVVPEYNPDWITYDVVVDNEYPPYVMRDTNGLSVGFDLDILRAIATDQQFNITSRTSNWDKMIEGVEIGKFDMALGGWATEEISDATKKHYDLSNPYIYAVDVIGIINPDIKINDFADLANYKVSTLIDTTWIDDLETLEGTGSVEAHESSYQSVESLLQKKADITLNDKGVMLYYANSMPEFNIQVSEIGYAGEAAEPYDLVMLSNKDHQGLVEKVNTGLANIVEDGTYEEIYVKWFGVAPDTLPSPFPSPVPSDSE